VVLAKLTISGHRANDVSRTPQAGGGAGNDIRLHDVNQVKIAIDGVGLVTADGGRAEIVGSKDIVGNDKYDA
jgi:hypothetical protein